MSAYGPTRSYALYWALRSEMYDELEPPQIGWPAGLHYLIAALVCGVVIFLLWWM